MALHQQHYELHAVNNIMYWYICRRDNEQLRQVITQLLTSVRQQKDTIGSLRNEVTNHNSDMENTITAMTEKLGGALKLQAKSENTNHDNFLCVEQI